MSPPQKHLEPEPGSPQECVHSASVEVHNMKVTFLNMQKITRNPSVHEQYKVAVEDAAKKDSGRVDPRQMPTAFYAVPLLREMNYGNGA